MPVSSLTLVGEALGTREQVPVSDSSKTYQEDMSAEVQAAWDP